LLVFLSARCGARSDLLGEQESGDGFSPTYATCMQQSDCGTGTFCYISPGRCAETMPLGFCAEDTDCEEANIPVCGCDDKPYPNACASSRAGQSYVAGPCIALDGGM
jgi:hypothetical protein